MRVSWFGMMFALVIVVMVQPCRAGEFAGRLERVDVDTVTLRGSDNQVLVVHVDHHHRLQAAPFLGRWVTVDFHTVQGMASATGFRCMAPR
jgi:hypothetical protein